MTTPNQPKPDGAYVWDSDSDYGTSIPEDQDNLLAMMRGNKGDGTVQANINFGNWLGNAISNLLNGFANLADAVADFVRQAFEGGEGPLADIADGQRDLNDRLSLMENISGYCNLTMSHNWTVGGSFTFVALPYDTYIGPHRHARHVSGIFNFTSDDGYTISGRARDILGNDRHGLVLEKKGTWDINAQVTIGPGNASGYAEISLAVMRCRPGGSNTQVYSRSTFPVEYRSDIYGYSVHKPVVFDNDGWVYYVLCEVRQRNTFWWPYWGGSQWASLSARRLDQDAGSGSMPPDSVPDGGNYD